MANTDLHTKVSNSIQVRESDDYRMLITWTTAKVYNHSEGGSGGGEVEYPSEGQCFPVPSTG